MLSIPIKNNKSFFLFGARGTGKTTWLKQKLPNELFINLLSSESYNYLSANPSRLINIIEGQKTDWIIIDEIQRIPELLNEIHSLIESKHLKFILTGSSARKLRQKGNNLLAGRARTYQMYPLTTTELGKDFNINNSLEFGNLPETYNINDKQEYLKSYITTYLREEILQEGLTRNIGNFSRFLETASFSQASVLTMSEIARESSISQKLVEGYFNILEDLLIAYRLPVFTKKAKRRMISHPKFYFFDTGVFNAIRPRGPLDEGAISEGALFETLFLQELIAINHYLQLSYQIFYWRTSNGTEVDFVLYGKNKLIAIEIKRSKTIRSKDLHGLKAFKKDYPIAECYCFYGGKFIEKIDNIVIKPFEQALKNLVSIL